MSRTPRSPAPRPPRSAAPAARPAARSWAGRAILPTLLLAALPVAVAAQEAAPEAEYLTAAAYADAGYPFSEAVRVGDLLYLSGNIGQDPETGELAPGGIGPETRQTMENIRETLERYGSSMDRVVKCTVMLADIAEWPAMNEVYRTFFEEGRYPARSAFGTTGLSLGARVEIECLALGGPGS